MTWPSHFRMPARLAGPLLLGLWITGTQPPSPATAPIPVLQPGVPISLQPGETYARSVDLLRGEFLHWTVEQHGLDLELIWRDSTGRVRRIIDAPISSHGAEDLVDIAPHRGRYLLEIRAVKATASGRFTVHEVVRGMPRPEDHRHLRADQLFRQLQRVAYTHPTEAVRAGEEALELWREIGLERNASVTEFTLLEPLRLIGEYQRVITAARRALPWFEVLGSNKLLTIVLNDLGKASLRLGDNIGAVKALERALDNTPADDPCMAADLWTALAMAYGNLGRSAEALDRFEWVEAKLVQCSSGRTPESHKTQANLFHSLGQLLHSLGRYDEAAQRFSLAREEYEEAGVDPTPAMIGLVDCAIDLRRFDLAEALLRDIDPDWNSGRQSPDSYLQFFGARLLQEQGRLDDARHAYESTLTAARRFNNRAFEAAALQGLGRLVHKDDPGLAENYFRQALKVLEQTHDPRQLNDARGWLAAVLHQQGRGEEAWAELQMALQGIEALRRDLPHAHFRRAYFAPLQAFYSQAIDVLWGLHQRFPEGEFGTQALQWHDRRLARELLGKQLATDESSKEADTARQTQRHQISRELTQWIHSPLTRDREQRFTELLHKLYALDEETKPRPQDIPVMEFGLQDIQKRLGSRDLLLSFAFSESSAYAWAVRAETVDFVRLGTAEALDSEIREFLRQLTEGGPLDLIDRLAGQLGASSLGHVPRIGEFENLLIIPDGPLHHVPWAALRLDGKYLIEQFAITVLPSLTYASLSQQAQPWHPERGLAILADSVFSERDPRWPGRSEETFWPETHKRNTRLVRAASALGLDVESRLPGTRREAAKIIELLGERADPLVFLQGFEASRRRFFELPFERLGTLHLATHALPDERPEIAGLLFSRYGKDGRETLGFVHFFEIAQLELDLDLVVLSACQTAVGQNLAGEGMLGLARSFQIAGANRILASLWKADDDQTALLMAKFYHGLADGQLPSEALRIAQLERLADPDATPADWALFVLHSRWND